MTKILLERRYKPTHEDVILKAFETLDVDKKGYLSKDELVKYITEEGFFHATHWKIYRPHRLSVRIDMPGGWRHWIEASFILAHLIIVSPFTLSPYGRRQFARQQFPIPSPQQRFPSLIHNSRHHIIDLDPTDYRNNPRYPQPHGLYPTYNSYHAPYPPIFPNGGYYPPIPPRQQFPVRQPMNAQYPQYPRYRSYYETLHYYKERYSGHPCGPPPTPSPQFEARQAEHFSNTGTHLEFDPGYECDCRQRGQCTSPDKIQEEHINYCGGTGQKTPYYNHYVCCCQHSSTSPPPA